MNENIYCRKDKTMHIMEKIYTTFIKKRVIELIGKTRIVPNQVTLFNMCLSMFTLYLAYKKYYIYTAILLQVYVFLDNLDGILARYKNMRSKLGAKLDVISDTFFYNLLFICIGVNKIDLKIIITCILIYNIYGLIATFYIVPQIKKIGEMKRDPIKRFFLNKGILLGMNIDTAGIIMFFCLILGCIKFMYVSIIILFILDLIYRLVELKVNIYLK